MQIPIKGKGKGKKYSSLQLASLL